MPLLRSDSQNIVDEIDAILHQNDDDGILFMTMRQSYVLAGKLDGDYFGVCVHEADVVPRFLLHLDNVLLGTIGVGPGLRLPDLVVAFGIMKLGVGFFFVSVGLLLLWRWLIGGGLGRSGLGRRVGIRHDC